MLFILQIALGVCIGLWLFRFLFTRRLSLPHPSAKEAIAVCAIAYAALWGLHIVLRAFL